MNLIEEVKERRILKTLIFYLGGSWAVIEALSFFIEKYDGNPNIFNTVVIMIGYGLPLTLVFQWFRGTNITKKLCVQEVSLFVVLLLAMSYTLYYTDSIEEVEIVQSDVISKSIAVLPFQNIGANSEADFYGDGFSDDVISNLSKASDFVVISRTSSFQFRDTNRSILDIRNKLKVEYVLEGNYRMLNNQLRLNVSLVNTETEKNLWSETFDGTTEDIFALQSEVANHIASSLKMELGHIENQQKVDPLAYEYFLKGNNLIRQHYISKPILDECMENLKKAISIDSTFAPAYVSAATVYIKYLYWGYEEYENVASKIKKYVEIAEKLNADKAEIYGVLAGLSHYNFEWAASQKYCDLALAENSNAPFTLLIKARNGMATGNADMAISSAENLLKIDPLTSTNQVYLAWIHGYFREYDKAIDLVHIYLEQYPGDNFGLWVLGDIYNHKGDHEKSVDYFLSRSVKSKNDNWALGYAYGRIGNNQEAIRIAETLISKKKSGAFVPSYMIGYIYLGMNDLDSAFYWFDKALIERVGWLGFIKGEAAFDEIRKDERYLGIIKKVGL